MTQKQALHSGEFNIAMEYGPFLDVFPIEHRDFHCYVGLPRGKQPLIVDHETLQVSSSTKSGHVSCLRLLQYLDNKLWMNKPVNSLMVK